MLILLSLHIVFIVTWFAGLFYIVRLFIYHREAQDKPEAEKNILSAQYKIMQRRLWFGITWPSAVITFIVGPWLWLGYFPHYITQPFFILKLAFVFALALYHLQCHNIYKKMQQDIFKKSSFSLRIWNEVASILLVAIVFLIVLKQNNEYVWYGIGLFLLAAALFIGINIYKKSREGKG